MRLPCRKHDGYWADWARDNPKKDHDKAAKAAEGTCSTCTLEARVVTLEGHRNQWRRIAFHLYDLINDGDIAKAQRMARETIEGSPSESPDRSST